MKNQKTLLIVLCPILALFLIGTIVFTAVQAKQINTLTNFIEVNMEVDLNEWDGSNINFDHAHPIYDDTAIIEAYKSGDTSKLDEEELFTLNTAKSVIEKLGINNKMSDYEKEKAIYDWQFDYVRYDSTQQSAIPSDINIEQYNYYPYGVLKYHQAICVGNATTFKLFMDMLEIENKIIHSTTMGEHAWNLIKLENDWYHVDLTFDGSDNTKTPAYNNFNVTDLVKQNAGYPWDSAEFPEATGTKYCMAVIENQKLDTIYDLPAALKAAQEKKKANVYVSFADHSPLDVGLLDMISSYMKDCYLYISQNYPMENGDTIYAIPVESTNTEEVQPEAEKYYDMDKMEQTILDVFDVETVD